MNEEEMISDGDNYIESLNLPNKDNIKQQAQQLETGIEANPVEATQQLPDVQNDAIQDIDGDNNTDVGTLDNLDRPQKFIGIEDKPYYNDWVNAEPSSQEFKNAYDNVVADYGKEDADWQLEQWKVSFEEALEDGNAEEAESLIEESPVVAEEALNDELAINEEAEQAIDGGNDAEVRNDIVKDTIGMLSSLTEDDEFELFAKQFAGGKDIKNNEKEQAKQKKKLLERDNQEAWVNHIDDIPFNKPTGGHSTGKLYATGESQTGGGYVYGKSRVRKGYQKALAKSLLADMLSPEDWNDSTFRNNILDHYKPYRNGSRLQDNIKMGLEEAIKTETEERKKRGLILNGLSYSDLDKIAEMRQGDKEEVVDKPEVEDIRKESSWLREVDPRVEEILNYEGFETGVGNPGVLTHKDEDFLGPDEYYDENGEIRNIGDYEEATDINPMGGGDVGGDAEWNSEIGRQELSDKELSDKEIEEEVDEDEGIPEEEKEETKKRRKLIAHWLHIPSRNLGDYKGNNGAFNDDRLSSAGGSFGTAFSHPTSNGGVSVGRPSSVNTSPKQIQQGSRGSVGGSMKPIDEAKNVAPSAKANATTGNRTSNGGTFGSGSVNKTGNSLIKVHKVALPNGEANNQADLFNGDGNNGGSNGEETLRNSYIKQLEQRIKLLDPEIQEHFDFSTKYKHTEYKETPLEDCDGGTLKEIEKILEVCGV